MCFSTDLRDGQPSKVAFFELLSVKMVSESSPGRLGRAHWPTLGPSWALLGRSWAALGALLGALGRSWGALGALLGRSWRALGRSWALLGAPWAILARFLTLRRSILGAPGQDFSGFQLTFAQTNRFARRRGDLRKTSKNQKTSGKPILFICLRLRAQRESRRKIVSNVLLN